MELIITERRVTLIQFFISIKLQDDFNLFALTYIDHGKEKEKEHQTQEISGKKGRGTIQ